MCVTQSKHSKLLPNIILKVSEMAKELLHTIWTFHSTGIVYDNNKSYKYLNINLKLIVSLECMTCYYLRLINKLPK